MSRLRSSHHKCVVILSEVWRVTGVPKKRSSLLGVVGRQTESKDLLFGRSIYAMNFWDTTLAAKIRRGGPQGWGTHFGTGLRLFRRRLFVAFLHLWETKTEARKKPRRRPSPNRNRRPGASAKCSRRLRPSRTNPPFVASSASPDAQRLSLLGKAFVLSLETLLRRRLQCPWSGRFL